jgi:hypothetical protein
MKLHIPIALLVLLPGLLVAQDERVPPKFELQGTASFRLSNLSSPSPYIGTRSWSKTPPLPLTPSCGYFVTKDVELLIDLRYAYSRNDDWWNEGPIVQQSRHQLGFGVGVAYNHQVTSFFVPYLAAKVGLSWTRMIQEWGYDSGWGRRRISFPDFVLGGRLFFSTEWAGLVFMEYTRTVPWADISWVEWDEYETIVFGIGFSVFI